jgi:branched-chain amino acid transport system ATP-binding protein
MYLLKIANLSKSFGGLSAVNDVSFEVNPGEIVGLIGPIGAGKTTVFNLITGFLSKDEGIVLFKKKDITKIKPFQVTSIGICRTFQLTSSFANMTVLENVKIATLCKNKGLDSDKKTKESIELVGLQEYENLVPGQLPHGHLKRLDIARALATSPELLLLDEPFSGLSISEIRSLVPVLQGLQARGITLVIIEHVLRELMYLTNKVIVLNFGRKIAEGKPETIVHDEKVIESYLGKSWGNRAT